MAKKKTGSREKQRARERQQRQAQEAQTMKQVDQQADFAEEAGLVQGSSDRDSPVFTFSVPAPFDTTTNVSVPASFDTTMDVSEQAEESTQSPFTVPQPELSTIAPNISEQAEPPYSPSLEALLTQHLNDELSLSDIARLLGVDDVTFPEPEFSNTLPGPSQQPSFSYSLPQSSNTGTGLLSTFSGAQPDFAFSSTTPSFGAPGNILSFAAGGSSVTPITQGPSREVLEDLLRATRDTLVANETELESMREEKTKLSHSLATSKNEFSETIGLLGANKLELEALRKQLAEEREKSAKIGEDSAQWTSMLEALRQQQVEAQQIYAKDMAGNAQIRADLEMLRQQQAETIQRDVQGNAQLQEELGVLRRQLEAQQQITSQSIERKTKFREELKVLRKKVAEERLASKKNMEGATQLKEELETLRQQQVEAFQSYTQNMQENNQLKEELETLRQQQVEIYQIYTQNMQENNHLKEELEILRREPTAKHQNSVKHKGKGKALLKEELELLRRQLGIQEQLSTNDKEENVQLKGEVEKLRKELEEEYDSAVKNAGESIQLKAELENLHKQIAEKSDTSARNVEENAQMKAELETLRKDLKDESEKSAKNAEENAQLRHLLTKECDASGKSSEKIINLAAQLRLQKRQVKEQENKMAESKLDQQSVIEKLKVSESERDDLQNRYDTVTEENYSLQVQLSDVEQSLKKTKSANADDIRRKNQQIRDHLATIATHEEQLKTTKEKIKHQDLQLKEKDDKLRVKEIDYVELNSEFKDIEKNEGILISNNEDLTEALEAAKQENKELQDKIENIELEIGDRAVLEAVLAESEANSKSLKEDIEHLEDQNNQLRSRLARVGQKKEKSNVEVMGRSLEDEVGGAEFFTSPSGDEHSSVGTQTVEMLNLAEQQSPDSSRSEATIIQNELEKPRKGKQKDIINALDTGSDNIQRMSSKKLAKSDKSEAIDLIVIAETPRQSSIENGKENPRNVDTKVVYIERPSVVTYVRHNPIVCWFQVERDMVTLLMFFYMKMLHFLSFLPGFHTSDRAATFENSSSSAIIFDEDLASTVPLAVKPTVKAGKTVPDVKADLFSTLTDKGFGRSAKEISGSTVNVGSFTPASRALSATPSADATWPAGNAVASIPSDLDPSLVGRTLFYFLLHVLFYLFVFSCAWNYSSLRSEVQIWRAGNELTHRLFWKYYRGVGSGRRYYGVLYHIFGGVGYAQKTHFYLHVWSKISRAFPG